MVRRVQLGISLAPSGRKVMFLNEKQIEEVETLATVLTLEQMADYFGISREALDAIAERQPEVALRYKRGRARAFVDVGGLVLTKARAGDIACAFFYLKTQARWRETDRPSDYEAQRKLRQDLSEMSISELQQLLGSVEDQLSAVAAPVNAPNGDDGAASTEENSTIPNVL